jgi:hypothetical protein
VSIELFHRAPDRQQMAPEDGGIDLAGRHDRAASDATRRSRPSIFSS